MTQDKERGKEEEREKEGERKIKLNFFKKKKREKEKEKEKMVVERVYNFVTELLTDHRGIFVTLFVLPLSLIYDLFFNIRAWIVFRYFSAPLLHKTRVEDVRSQILKWKSHCQSQGKVRMCSARGGWQSISPGMREYKSKSYTISVNLMDVLEFNKEKKTVRLEPMVSMGQLTHFLLPRGFTLPILPEMDDLTIGGLYMGSGIETSSHKYGLLNDIVLEAEIITSDGEVLVCSKTSNPELFDALPWSYGTLGFLLSITLSVVECKEYVEIKYYPCHTLSKGVSLFQSFVEAPSPPEFVEALGYSKDEIVVMTGQMVDYAAIADKSKINVISRWHKPAFYKHVQGFLADSKEDKSKKTSISQQEDVKEDGKICAVEYIPLRDYYHRHTKSIFWELEQIIPFCHNVFFRWLIGWAVPPKVSFLKLTQTEAIRKLYEEQHCIQDLFVPIASMEKTLRKIDDVVGVYPLWLCPTRIYNNKRGFVRPPPQEFLQKPIDDEKNFAFYVDVGVYGIPRSVLEKKPYDNIRAMNEMEDYVTAEGGFQMLYADSYLTFDGFRAMFNIRHYEAMKRKFDTSDGFPHVFTKVCKKGIKTFLDQNRKED